MGWQFLVNGINLCRYMAKEKPEMLTARQFAARSGVSYVTVMGWLRKKLVPGAELRENTPLGTYWEIPASSVGKVTRQKRGPKPKAQAEEQGTATTTKKAKVVKKGKKESNQ